MYLPILITIFILFLVFVTVSAYRLGKNKTENARTAAMIGFVLAFFPPFALVYLLILLLKNDSSIV
jgi:4-amino-4-deoxy-L-arabinose transferase-like glycosyltransferase